jgi:phytoene synthase
MEDAAYSDYRDRYYRPGSSFYYSTLAVDETTRDKLVTLFCFYQEITGIVEESREANVALKRLEWWTEEIERLFSNKSSGNPRHPIAKKLGSWIRQSGITAEMMNDIVLQLGLRLKASPFHTEQEWKQYCHGTRGNLCSILSGIENDIDHINTEDYLALAEAIEITSQLKRYGDLFHLNRLHFSTERLQHYGLNAELVLTEQDPELSRRFVKEQAEKALHLLDEFLTALRQSSQAKSSVLYLIAQLQKSLCREIVRDPDSVIESSIKLTPLRKAWTYWKHSFRLP